MKNYALINGSGIVENVVLWDGESGWQPPAGFTAVQSDAASVGWSYGGGTFTAPAVTVQLADAKTTQLAAIESAFYFAASANVTDEAGNTWNGGFDSAQKIYGAAQLAQAGGTTSVTIFDAGNVGHELTIAEATAVAVTVGAAYQSAFAKYQGLKVKIAAATTMAEMLAIVW